MLSLQKVAAKIDCSDVRTAEKWCRRNKVTIHLEGRKKYVLDIDLETALELKYIDTLKMQYPSDFEGVYRSRKEEDLLALYRIINSKPSSLNGIEEYYSSSNEWDDFEIGADDLSSKFLKKYRNVI